MLVIQLGTVQQVQFNRRFRATFHLGMELKISLWQPLTYCNNESSTGLRLVLYRAVERTRGKKLAAAILSARRHTDAAWSRALDFSKPQCFVLKPLIAYEVLCITLLHEVKGHFSKAFYGLYNYIERNLICSRLTKECFTLETDNFENTRTANKFIPKMLRFFIKFFQCWHVIITLIPHLQYILPRRIGF